jgi:hypothetical protein
LFVGVLQSRSPTYVSLAFFAIVFISSNSGSAVEVSQSSRSVPYEAGKREMLPRGRSSFFTSWDACISAAELARSERDFKFFMRASNLSNAKPWFVNHSKANEARFCYDVGICEQSFGRDYSAADSVYQPC